MYTFGELSETLINGNADKVKELMQAALGNRIQPLSTCYKQYLKDPQQDI